MRIVIMMFGSAVAIAITVFVCNYLNVYSNPSFEPYFSPWPWLIIYLIINMAQLLVMTSIIFAASNVFKFNLSTTQFKYLLIGFIFSVIYVAGLTFATQYLPQFNNYLFVFIIYPVIIYVGLVFLVKLAEI